MKNVNNFKVKFFELQFKKGWQIAEFCDFFGVSYEEFFVKLEEKFPPKTYQRLARRFKKDSGKESRKSKTKTENVEKEDIDTVCDDEHEPIEEILTIEGVCERISQLKAEKQEISEKKEEYLKGKEKENYRLQEAKKVLEDIQKEIRRQESIIQSVRDKLSNFDQKLAVDDKRIAEIEVELEILQERKNELNKVVIKVLEDSSIECEIPVQDYWKDIFDNISKTEEATDKESEKLLEVVEMLTIKNVRIMSKIFSIIQQLEKLGKSFKIVFEKESDLAVALEIFEYFEVEIEKE